MNKKSHLMHFHPLYVLLAAGMVCGPTAWADGSAPQMQAPRPDKEIRQRSRLWKDRLAITRERPLFRPDRRPLAAPPKLADVPPPPAPPRLRRKWRCRVWSWMRRTPRYCVPILPGKICPRGLATTLEAGGSPRLRINIW